MHLQALMQAARSPSNTEDVAGEPASGSGSGKDEGTELDSGAKEYGSSSEDKESSGAPGAGSGEGDSGFKGAEEYGNTSGDADPIPGFTDGKGDDAPLPGFSDDSNEKGSSDTYSIPESHSGSDDHATEGPASGKGDATQIDDYNKDSKPEADQKKNKKKNKPNLTIL
ncbi:hypothetical protein DSO57_1013307 [Entomophthora muscae]|uniref:Uncharacterized protein n=1 Tax=Entomophthora muscae TaxID=34485 RepID=A0ACC2TG68_9FUNG|nr:hypothetical protein DSO57_1013307 [Entomophthora muscae]